MLFFSHLTPGGLRTTLCSTDSAALFVLLSLLYVLLSVFLDVCQPLVSEAPPPSSSCLKSPLWLAETQTDRRNNIFNKGCEIMMRWDDTEVTWMWLILYNRGGTRQRPHNTILYESQFFTFLFNCSKWIYSLALLFWCEYRTMLGDGRCLLVNFYSRFTCFWIPVRFQIQICCFQQSNLHLPILDNSNNRKNVNLFFLEVTFWGEETPH